VALCCSSIQKNYTMYFVQNLFFVAYGVASLSLRTGIYWFTILELITLIEWAARARW